MPDPIAFARTLSDGVLFPGALEVDASDIVPVNRLDRLASGGFYGLAGPAEAGGMGVADMATALEVIEIIASGCLTTAFVWIQHHGAVRALSEAPKALRDAWIGRLCAGEVRAGVAFSGLRRPGPPILTASQDGEGWRFQGFAPWVSGWGRIDVVRAAARRENGDIVWALVDATAGPTLQAERLRLAAVNASATVTLSFDQHAVPGDRVISIQPFDEWRERDRASLRLNGSLALGVARRCAFLLESEALTAELDECRRSLDQASPEAMPEQRARASELALRAATELVVLGGGRAIALDHQAQRLAREALFLLVFGQTAAIKAAQLTRPYNQPGPMMSRMAEEQIAWTAVKTGEAVVTSDGTNIGKVVEVAALANEDIFHGIVFEHAHRHKHYLAPAADIERITTEAVHLSVDGAKSDEYEEFEQLHISRLGLSGIFRWKHFGWKDSNE